MQVEAIRGLWNPTGQARHLGALLGGELPAGIGAEQVLLPGPGQLRTVCTCPDRDEQPCKHAAAACYQYVPLLDEDPFALLLLRGRSRLQVLAALREQRGPTRPAALQGRLARDAYHATPGPLPSPEPPPPRPCDSDRPMFAEPPAACGISAAELAELAAGATRLAWELLTACAGR
jgi:SWIM zinc finger